MTAVPGHVVRSGNTGLAAKACARAFSRSHLGPDGRVPARLLLIVCSRIAVASGSE